MRGTARKAAERRGKGPLPPATFRLPAPPTPPRLRLRLLPGSRAEQDGRSRLRHCRRLRKRSMGKSKRRSSGRKPVGGAEPTVVDDFLARRHGARDEIARTIKRLGRLPSVEETVEAAEEIRELGAEGIETLARMMAGPDPVPEGVIIGLLTLMPGEEADRVVQRM